MTLLSRPVHGNIRAAAGIDWQRSEVGFMSDIRRRLELAPSPEE